VPVFVLSIHADYACRHSGACCTAGWRIPVEPACEDRLVHSGRAHRVGSNEAPLFERDGMLTVLALARDGACSCFEPASRGRASQCRIQGALGHDALPSACRHFPRVAVTDDTGTYVTLSHFCPTAASMLFCSVPLAIVVAPPSFHSVHEYEGLDARGALPPLLRPGMLMEVESHHAWELHIVRVLADETHTPESALWQLGEDARIVSAWAPGEGTILDRIEGLRHQAENHGPPEGAHYAGSFALSPHGRPEGGHEAEFNIAGRRVSRSAPLHPGLDLDTAGLDELVRACVPAGLGAAAQPAALGEIDAALVQPGWPALSRPIKRYLAAKAFASWIPWHGRGLRWTVTALAAARAVLLVEAARQCGLAGRVLDRPLLVEAIRQSDLLLVHKVSPKKLADTVDR